MTYRLKLNQNLFNRNLFSSDIIKKMSEYNYNSTAAPPLIQSDIYQSDGTFTGSVKIFGTLYANLPSSGGTPSLPLGSIQFNDNLTFGGSENLLWTNSIMNVTGQVGINLVNNNDSFSISVLNSGYKEAFSVNKTSIGSDIYMGSSDITTSILIGDKVTDKIGFFGSTPVVRQELYGSKLDGLVNALVNLGLVYPHSS